MDKIIAISCCFVIATFSSCTAYISHDDNVAISEMVKNGANPIEAKCAVKENTTLCVIVASKK